MADCTHPYFVISECGSKTCSECHILFENSLVCEWNTQSTHPDSSRTSVFYDNLGKYGIFDKTVAKKTQEIFLKAMTNKSAKKHASKLVILAASVFYAYHYLGQPQPLHSILVSFNLPYRSATKGLKACQIAMQECSAELGGNISLFTSTHTETLKTLLRTHNIPMKHYPDIEKLIEHAHRQKNVHLTEKINALWISALFFWILRFNPSFDQDEFISLGQNSLTCSSQQLKSNLVFFKKLSISPPEEEK